MSSQNKIITLLRNEKKWAAIPVGKRNIQMSRRLAGQTVTVLLSYEDKGKYSVQPATYRFRSANYHYDYATGERRFSRNKQVLKSLFKALKESTIAGYIHNLDTFLVVNEGNRKSDKEKLKKELKTIVKR